MSALQSCTLGPAQDICPDQEECLHQVLALCPQGRAWGNHDGGPFSGVMLGFWNAFASLLAYVNQRICAAREEFFCATASETLDVWDAQYGLPDGCEPFPDLCSKVAAQGGQSCDVFVAAAARNGWAIACLPFCGAVAGSARAGSSPGARLVSKARAGALRAGQYITCELEPLVPRTLIARAGSARAGQSLNCVTGPLPVPSARAGARSIPSLLFAVYTKSSPSYTPPTSFAPRAGRIRAGQRLGCAEPSIDALECLLERIAPAHAQLFYEVY